MSTEPKPSMRVMEPSVRDRGSRIAWLLLKLVGWTLRYDGTPPGCGVVIAYPHTSNWDFVVGIIAKWALGVPLIYLGKDSLFRIPVLGWLMRLWGGMPVDRGSSHGVIAQMTDHLKAAQARGERVWLALSPEGTRKRTEYWRSGFYHIAVAAQMPIGLAYFNFAKREIGVHSFLLPSSDAQADLAEIARCYAECAQAMRPEKAGPIKFRPT
jgi:1-acyl-sn-glycerol-3-phosphate acyltransferase